METALDAFIENAAQLIDAGDVDFQTLQDTAEEMLGKLQELRITLGEILEQLEEEDGDAALRTIKRALS